MAAPAKPLFGRLAIIGLGLIGASVAAGVKRSGVARHLLAYDKDPAALATGRELGLIDAEAASIAEAAESADLALVAAPVGASAEIFKQLDPEQLITDVGSVKAGVVAAAREAYGSLPPALVPGHPLAGSERQGAAAGSADLFNGRRVILTPVDSTDPRAVRQVQALWTALGARVSCMAPERHDELLAGASHLPHLLAYALLETLAKEDPSLDCLPSAAGGFRDFSRIAAADPALWRDICQMNAGELGGILQAYQGTLGRIAALMKNGDFAALEALFARGQAARQKYEQLQQQEQKQGGSQ